jgi:hypothetical protein
MNKICEFKLGTQIRVYLWKSLIRGAGGLVNSLTSSFPSFFSSSLSNSASINRTGTATCLLAAYRQIHKEDVKNATKIRKGKAGKMCDQIGS